LGWLEIAISKIEIYQKNKYKKSSADAEKAALSFYFRLFF
jgi:hypothetical protein